MTDGKEIALNNIVRRIEYDEQCIPEPQLVVPAVDKPYCKHEQINIYQYHRKIYCKVCGCELDPFDWLLEMGNLEGRQFSTLRWLGWEIKRRKEEIEELETTIKRLKSQKRRI